MSIKVINIGGGIDGPLTVDSTEITVDSTLITADQTVNYTTEDNEHVLRVIPRAYETEVVLVMWDEMTSVETRIDCEAIVSGGFLEVPFTFYFKEGDSMETKLLDSNNNLIWRGKIYATSQTDLQNFTLNPSPNNIIRI